MGSKIINRSLMVFLLWQLPACYAICSHQPVMRVGKPTQANGYSGRAQEQANSSQQKALSSSNSWHGLVPLQSSRADVEKLLGKAKTSHGFTYVYETENETVNILYSAGPCKLSAVERWNVALDIVLRMDVRPRKKMLIQELHLDKVRYSRLPEAHPENWIRYMNDEDGVMVETISNGRTEEVYTITYWPRTKDKSLRCSQ